MTMTKDPSLRVERSAEQANPTPGPWRAVGDAVIGPNNEVIARTNLVGAFDEFGTADANARLIAAAPDPLAALEFIRDGYDNQDVNHVDFRVKAYQVALDALSSAQSAGGRS